MANNLNIPFHMSALRTPSQTGPVLYLSVLFVCSSVKTLTFSFSSPNPLAPLFSSKTMCHAHQNAKASAFEGVLLDHRANKHPCQEKAIWGPSLTEPELSWETHSSYNGQRRPFVESLGAAGLALDQTGCVCIYTFLHFAHTHAQVNCTDKPECTHTRTHTHTCAHTHRHTLRESQTFLISLNSL